MLHSCMAIFLGCFFLGVLVANLWLRNENLWMGFVFETQIRNLANTGLSWQEIMWQVLPARIIPWGILLVIWNFLWGNLFLHLWVGWLGLSGGFVFSSCLCRYGFSGIFYMLVSGFPQILLYLAAYLLLIFLWDARRNMRWNRRNQMPGSMDNRKEKMLFLLLVFLDFGIYVLGVWLECSVNPWLLSIVAAVQ